MATKPTSVPEWASDPGADIVEPAAGKKAQGWIGGMTPDRPPAQFFNWWKNLTWKWVEYLKDGVFTTTATNGTCIDATGDGTGAGLQATGGATDGKGVIAHGGGTNGIGVVGWGKGTGAGVYGNNNGGTGQGVYGSVSNAGTGSAVKGEAFGTGNAHGVEGSGKGTGYGVLGTGSASGSDGVRGTSTGAAGVRGVTTSNTRGGAVGQNNGNGPGLEGFGGGPGAGGYFVGGDDGEGVIAEPGGNNARAAIFAVPQADPTAPLKGDIIVHTTTGKASVYDGNTQARLVGNVNANTSQSSAVTATSETDFDRTCQIPANKLRAGSRFKIRALVLMGANGVAGRTIRLRIYLGATAIFDVLDITVVDTGGALTEAIVVDAEVTVQTVGAGGTMTSNYLAKSPMGVHGYGETGQALNTTGANTIKASAQFNNTGCSARLISLTVDEA